MCVPLLEARLCCSILSTFSAMSDTFWTMAWILSTRPSGWILSQTHTHTRTRQKERKGQTEVCVRQKSVCVCVSGNAGVLKRSGWFYQTVRLQGIKQPSEIGVSSYAKLCTFITNSFPHSTHAFKHIIQRAHTHTHTHLPVVEVFSFRFGEVLSTGVFFHLPTTVALELNKRSK